MVVQVRSGSFRLGALLKHEAVLHVCSERPVGWKSVSMTFPGISGTMPEPLMLPDVDQFDGLVQHWAAGAAVGSDVMGNTRHAAR